MDGDRPLFLGAPEALIIHGHFTLGEGWTVTVQLRRQFEGWASSPAATYERLTTDEMEDVIRATLGSDVLADEHG